MITEQCSVSQSSFVTESKNVYYVYDESSTDIIGKDRDCPIPTKLILRSFLRILSQVKFCPFCLLLLLIYYTRFLYCNVSQFHKMDI